MALTTPSAEEALQLFHTVEEHFPSANLGDDKWYILVISAISTGGHASFAADLYKYLISKPQFQTSDSRKALIRRLREALVKLVSVVGVPKPLEAIFSIAEVERDEDKDYSFSRGDWKSGDENIQRGQEWLSQIYRQNLTATQNVLAAHRDFCEGNLAAVWALANWLTGWISREITYGLYLSDHTILDGIETELVVLSGIMMQNLRRETGWHLRGTRRIGVSHDDVELVQQSIEKVAQFCGLNLNQVPRVRDIEHEVEFA